MKEENCWATDLLTNLAKLYADDVEVIEIIEDTLLMFMETMLHMCIKWNR